MLITLKIRNNYEKDAFNEFERKWKQITNAKLVAHWLMGLLWFKVDWHGWTTEYRAINKFMADCTNKTTYKRTCTHTFDTHLIEISSKWSNKYLWIILLSLFVIAFVWMRLPSYTMVVCNFLMCLIIFSITKTVMKIHPCTYECWWAHCTHFKSI